MTSTDERTDTGSEPPEAHSSRLQLLWDVLIFQFKLAFDGMRDLLLSPLSIISAVIGLLAGGDAPDRYFRQLLHLGRRSETWLNLFGHRRHSGTADELLSTLRERVLEEARENPWVSQTGTRINRKLDDVNAAASRRHTSNSDD